MNKNRMTKRERLESGIGYKKARIAVLQHEILELRKKTFLLTDKEQRFEEKMETVGRGKSKRESLIGRVYWKEEFKDMSTNESIWVERSKPVRVDGEWIINNYEL